MIIGGLHGQLWSRNNFQSSILHDLDLWPLDPEINRYILDSLGACVWSFMIIGGLQNQLWSGNHLQLTMPHDLDLLTSRINRAHPWLMGSKCLKFHDHRRITGSVMVRKPFSFINANDLDLWPFYPKINWAHSWLMGSKCMKFHDHRWITGSVMVRKPFSIINAPWSWPLTFWSWNQ